MEKDIELRGLRFHYTDTTPDGASPVGTIILMHGWGCNHTTLASVERVALGAGWRVVNVDFQGFGTSEEPATVWGIEDYTSAFEEFVRSLSLPKPPALLGHSFGGRVGILYASRNPVDRLILVDAAGIKPSRSLKYYLKVYSFKAGKRLMPLLVGRKRADEWVEKKRRKSGSSDYASATPRMRSILSKVVNEDLTDRLPLISCPALLIWGENDTATPLRDAKKMEKLIPDAGLVSYPGCGHYSFLDNPRGFAAVLNKFLTTSL